MDLAFREINRLKTNYIIMGTPQRQWSGLGGSRWCWFKAECHKALLVCHCSAPGVETETCLKLFFTLLIWNYHVSSTEDPKGTNSKHSWWSWMLASCSAKLQSPSWEGWIIEILLPLKKKGFLLLTPVQQRPCAAAKEGHWGKFLINGGGRNLQIFSCLLRDEKGTADHF